jgi:hypothetical protein
MSIKRIDILGNYGIPMRVLLVPASEQSPNHPDKPAGYRDTLEFYDGRYDHTPDGQFISEYYLSSLQNGDRSSGLDLCGGDRDWRIDARTKEMVLSWAAYHIYPRP